MPPEVGLHQLSPHRAERELSLPVATGSHTAFGLGSVLFWIIMLLSSCDFKQGKSAFYRIDCCFDSLELFMSATQSKTL